MRHIFTPTMRLMACLMLALAALTQPASAQLPPTEEAQARDNKTWYLDDVINRTFIARNDFEYYYQPSAGELQQQRDKGEVTYFLNTPGHYSVKKTQQAIDDIMASFDDVQAVNEWHAGNGNNVVRDYRHADNRFRFSIGRREVDDGGIYFVSVTEAANHYQSLGGDEPAEKPQKATAKQASAKKDKKTASTKRSKRQRRAVTDEDVQQHDTSIALTDDDDQPVAQQSAMTEAERRAIARTEQRRQKELEKQEKKQREQEEKERKRQEKLEKKQQQEAEKQRLKAEKEQKKQAAKQAAAADAARRTFYHDDIVLWLSEKYDYVVIDDQPDGCTMTSSAVTDQEMAKLTIKNALKSYKAKMAVPWSFNEKTQRVETGYTVGENVLVFAIGQADDGKILVTVTEVTGDDFNAFKSRLKE